MVSSIKHVNESEFNEDLTDTSYDEINTEIRRMSRAAEMILDSIRDEANSIRRDRSIDIVEGESTPPKYCQNHSEEIEEELFKISNIQEERTLIVENVTATIVNGTQDLNKHDSEEKLQNIDEDDDMIDELERLESVSAAIRESLDVEDDFRMISSPLILHQIHDYKYPIQRSPALPELTKTSVVKSNATPPLQKMLEPDATIPVIRCQEDSSKLDQIEQEIIMMEECIVDLLTSVKLVQYTSKDDVHTQSTKILKMAVVIVWTVVLLLLVHAKFSLNHTNGFVHFSLVM